MNLLASMRRTAGLLLLGMLLLGLGAAFGNWWARQGAATPAAASRPDARPAAPPLTGSAMPAPLAAGSPAPERRVLYWYDPMKPSQHFDHPGKSPYMDMALQPRYADAVSDGAAEGPGLAVSTADQQALGLRLATVERTRLSERIEAPGSLQLSERDISIVQARTAGFVERVYPHAPGDVMAAGSPLVDLMNPEWAGAQQEYLAVRAMQDSALTQAARTRLQLLGMSPALIGQVEATGQPVPVTTLSAPSAGELVELAVRPGMSVTAGMTLARINGLETLWLELAVPESQSLTLAVGQRVTAQLAAAPGKRLSGRVLAILPEANPDSRTVRVRIELPNPGQRLRAGMSAEATLESSGPEVLAVPSDAVIRTGSRALVYLAGPEGHFRPVQVEPGAEHDGKLEIRSGLQAGQQVVASGQFLLDSEASLRGLGVVDPKAVVAPGGGRP